MAALTTLPSEPSFSARANNRQLRYRVMRDLYPLLEELHSGSDSAASAARKSLRDHLTAIAPAFSQNRYFMSDEYSLVDCCMGPMLWRLEYFAVKLPNSARVLQKYGERLFERPAFRSSLSEQEKELRAA